MEELTRSFPQTNSDENENEFISHQLCDKYKGYSTANPVEITYIQKLVQRVTQIFSFFKMRSKQQYMFSTFEERISSRFDHYLGKIPLDLGDIFSFAVQIIQPGFFSKPTQTSSTRRVFMRVPSKENPPAHPLLNRSKRAVRVADRSNDIQSLFKANSIGCSSADK